MVQYWLGEETKYRFHFKGGIDEGCFRQLIEAAFLIAWNDPKVAWTDDFSVDVPLCPPHKVHGLVMEPLVLQSRYLVYRKPLIDTLMAHYGPTHATAVDRGGTELLAEKQIGDTTIIVRRPKEPSGHELMEASGLLREALAKAGIPASAIERMLADLDFSGETHAAP